MRPAVRLVEHLSAEGDDKDLRCLWAVEVRRDTDRVQQTASAFRRVNVWIWRAHKERRGQDLAREWFTDLARQELDLR